MCSLKFKTRQFFRVRCKFGEKIRFYLVYSVWCAIFAPDVDKASLFASANEKMSFRALYTPLKIYLVLVQRVRDKAHESCTSSLCHLAKQFMAAERLRLLSRASNLS